MADIKPSYVGSEKLVTSDILFQNMKNFDKRREEKVREKLWIEEHYKFNVDGTGAVTIVTDGTAALPTDVELSVVQAKVLKDDPHTPYVVGETVDLIPEKEIYMKETDLQIEDSLLDLSEFDNVTP